MLKQYRVKRIKTQFSKQSSLSVISSLDYYRQKQGNRQEKKQKPNHNNLSRILKLFKQQSKYEDLSDSEIYEQREILQSKIKQMNQQMRNIENKTKNQRNQFEKRRGKSSIKKQMALDYENLCKDRVSNSILISSLEYQYQQNLRRIQKHNHEVHKPLKVVQFSEKVKSLKHQLRTIKKNKFKREKTLINKTQKSDNDQLYELEEDLKIVSKKEQKFREKVINQNEEILQRQYSLERLKLVYDSYKDGYNELQQNNIRNSNQEHLKVLHKTRAKKLNLLLRKEQREEQSYKRQYYKLLAQCDQKIQKCNQIDEKKSQIQQMINQTLFKQKKLIDQVQKTLISQKRYSSNDYLFQKSTTKKKKSQSHYLQQNFEKKKLSKRQNQFNINNASGRQQFRKINNVLTQECEQRQSISDFSLQF